MKPVDKKRLSIATIAIAIITAIIALLWGTARPNGNPECQTVINGICQE